MCCVVTLVAVVQEAPLTDSPRPREFNDLPGATRQASNRQAGTQSPPTPLLPLPPSQRSGWGNPGLKGIPMETLCGSDPSIPTQPVARTFQKDHQDSLAWAGDQSMLETPGNGPHSAEAAGCQGAEHGPVCPPAPGLWAGLGASLAPCSPDTAQCYRTHPGLPRALIAPCPAAVVQASREQAGSTGFGRGLWTCFGRGSARAVATSLAILVG